MQLSNLNLLKIKKFLLNIKINFPEIDQDNLKTSDKINIFI